MTPLLYLSALALGTALNLLSTLVGAFVAGFALRLGWRAADRLFPKKTS